MHQIVQLIYIIITYISECTFWGGGGQPSLNYKIPFKIYNFYENNNIYYNNLLNFSVINGKYNTQIDLLILIYSNFIILDTEKYYNYHFLLIK